MYWAGSGPLYHLPERWGIHWAHVLIALSFVLARVQVAFGVPRAPVKSSVQPTQLLDPDPDPEVREGTPTGTDFTAGLSNEVVEYGPNQD
jgi:hypothetical protein